MEHGGRKTIVDATSAIGQFSICQPFVIHGQLLVDNPVFYDTRRHSPSLPLKAGCTRKCKFEQKF